MLGFFSTVCWTTCWVCWFTDYLEWLIMEYCKQMLACVVSKRVVRVLMLLEILRPWELYGERLDQSLEWMEHHLLVFRLETSAYKKALFSRIVRSKKFSAKNICCSGWAVADKVQCKLLQDHFRLAACEELPVMSVAVINTLSHIPLTWWSFLNLMWLNRWFDVHSKSYS